jgi:hypothetical protein
MSDTNAALSYTLGALFGFVALAAFIEVVFALKNVAASRSLKANHIYLIAIYAFTQSMTHKSNVTM